VLIIRHNEVDEILGGQERRILDLVRTTYQLHDEGRTVVPFSTFLRFPNDDRNRIIGLPAYVGGGVEVAGMKWISSFPGNIQQGRERASAAIVLNSMSTGHPEALVEASLISAKRTAASAAVAAALLTVEPKPSGVTLFGCGVINREILRFLMTEFPSIAAVTLFDSDPRRAEDFSARAAELWPGLALRSAATSDEALAAHRLISIATTASTPHLGLDSCQPGSTVLHVSLRDLETKAILAAQNVVDDVAHVCRERTSLHLAELETGDRRFVDVTIGQLLRGGAPWTRDSDRVAVFSPFGLGALDIALAAHVAGVARDKGIGTRIEGFLAPSAHPGAGNNSL
jgi:2,3-diaminopropionate biosynthesis protein SbnB